MDSELNDPFNNISLIFLFSKIYIGTFSYFLVRPLRSLRLLISMRQSFPDNFKVFCGVWKMTRNWTGFRMSKTDKTFIAFFLNFKPFDFAYGIIIIWIYYKLWSLYLQYIVSMYCLSIFASMWYVIEVMYEQKMLAVRVFTIPSPLTIFAFWTRLRI